MRIEKTALLVVVTLAVGLGCMGMESPKVERGPVYLHVKNINLLDADVYLLSGGQQHRLGLVTTNRTERFRVSPALIAPPGNLRVMADLLASNANFVSSELMLRPGDVVQLVVQPNIDSSYVIRR